MITYEDLRTALPDAQEYDNYLLTNCVYHDDRHPSMLIFKDGFWRCLGCGKWGGWRDLWDKLKGRPIRVRSEKRVGWMGPNISDYDSLNSVCYQAHLDLLQFSSYQWYLEQRGLDGRIEINELGYFEGWYTVPVYDKLGNFVTAVFRAAPHVQKVSGERYRTMHAPVPYVPDWRLLETSKFIFVVYGVLDALTLAELRMPVMTSTAGLNFNPEWLDEYRKPILIIPDDQEEERKSAIELQKALGWRGKMIRLDYPINAKDPNGFFEVGRKEDLRTQLINHT